MLFVHLVCCGKKGEKGQAGGQEGVDIGCHVRFLTQDKHRVVDFNDNFSFKGDSAVIAVLVVLVARQCEGVVLIIR